MTDKKPSPSAIRPLPYYNIEGTVDDARLAKALRQDFVPKVKRLLPGHHLGGQRHDFSTSFIKRHKVKYPYFFRTDIRQFYPSVRHQDLIVGAQIAYRDLLNLQYVPQSFKTRYVGAMREWCNRLPLNKGIPLGSPLSAILAPVMLIPLWLEIKRRFRVPFMVYMDDILVCTTDQRQSMEIYTYIENYLSTNYALELNSVKTSSGRFSRDSVTFCGWQFAGGYVSITDAKLGAFRDHISDLITRSDNTDIHRFIKSVNRKITGFGHYYKFGNVAGQFRMLDMFIRNTVRQWLATHAGRRGYTIAELSALGLRSLEELYVKAHSGNVTGRQTVKTNDSPVYHCAPVTHETGIERDSHPNINTAVILEKIHLQLAQLLSLERKQFRLMSELVNMN